MNESHCPWQVFALHHEPGERLCVFITNVTDFGLFCALNGGIDGDIEGLVHLSDITWEPDDTDAIQQYSVGSEVEVQILSIDVARQRVSLGIKQLRDPPDSGRRRGGRNGPTDPTPVLPRPRGPRPSLSGFARPQVASD
ncbi:MAG: S1 RNA-binding domain-containing protein [Pseudomonadota bacterium]